MKNPSVLFIVPYPSDGASNRLRVEQYLPYLEKEGIRYRLRPFVSRKFFKILYVKGRWHLKIFYFLISVLNRIIDILRSLNYDIVFIHREALPVGSALIEILFSKIGKKIIFDFDDAIFLPNTSAPNIYLERIKNPNKVSKIIELSDCVIAGNAYLKEYASAFNKKVAILPTPIDTDKYKAVKKEQRPGSATIGWIGSFTTRVYLDSIRGALEALKAQFPGVKLKFIGNWQGLESRIKGAEYKEWSLESELDDMRSFDIGIMPMPDDMWTKGKCGFKAILYMACGIPVVASPVGANLTIINDEVNGFFASSGEEWVDRLSRLIADPELRRRVGKAGRLTVEERYSVARTASSFIGVLNAVHGGKK